MREMIKRVAPKVEKGTTLKVQVYEFLREQILSGAIAPGARVVEEKISNDLEVSRSPVRESIRMLEKDGLLIVNKSGGVTVVEPSLQDFQHMFECRVEMEPLAAYYAAIRRTREEVETIRNFLLKMGEISEGDFQEKIYGINSSFHEAIVKASNNPWLINLVSHLRGLNIFYRKAILDENPKHLKQAYLEHQQIFQAIVDQEAPKAKALMKEHIESDYILFMEVCKKRGV